MSRKAGRASRKGGLRRSKRATRKGGLRRGGLSRRVKRVGGNLSLSPLGRKPPLSPESGWQFPQHTPQFGH